MKRIAALLLISLVCFQGVAFAETVLVKRNESTDAEPLIVWLSGSKAKPPQLGTYLVNHFRLKFAPKFMVVPKDSILTIRNSDDVYHASFSFSEINPFEAGMQKPGTLYSLELGKSGVLDLRCAIHPQMLAYVVVVDSSHYLQIDQGKAEAVIENVEPGEYVVNMWTESKGITKSETLAVSKNKQATIIINGN